ncbi:MAG: hydrogenase maturation nickel metallochaperone HypA [Thermoplasmata archaeon]|nr:hydrogenase maturation nickel metallochaperone HypA [Thermoplasmata archaeon]
MHELSVMSQIIESILSEGKKRSATKIEEVDLQIGEYTMLGDEQMEFAYEVLSKDTILQGSKLKISHVKGKIECSCGYRGRVDPYPDSPHKIVPILECPKCKGGAKIVEGRECLIRNIRMVVPDV